MSEEILICTCACGKRTGVSEYAIGMETTCTECGRSFAVSSENTSSAKPDMSQPQKRIEETLIESYTGETPPGCCDRCGKNFRGDWDKHETNVGTCCNICANSAYSDITVIKPIQAEVVDVNENGQNDEVDSREFEKGEKWWLDPDNPRFKRMLMILAIGVIILGVSVLLFDEPGSTLSRPESAQDTTRAEDIELSLFVTYFVYGLRLIFFFFGTFLPLYIALNHFKKLPNDTMLKNIVAVAIISVPFALLWFFSSILLVIPFAGFIVRLLVLYVFLNNTYGLTLREFIIFVFMTSFTNVIVFALNSMVFGIIGLIVT